MADQEKDQNGGRTRNAAVPLPPGESSARPEDYPEGESRSFEGPKGNPAPRQGAGDTSPVATNEGRLGPQSDPVEGKRE